MHVDAHGARFGVLTPSSHDGSMRRELASTAAVERGARRVMPAAEFSRTCRQPSTQRLFVGTSVSEAAHSLRPCALVSWVMESQAGESVQTPMFE